MRRVQMLSQAIANVKFGAFAKKSYKIVFYYFDLYIFEIIRFIG